MAHEALPAEGETEGYKTPEERSAADGSVRALLEKMTPADVKRFIKLVGDMAARDNPLPGVRRVQQLAAQFLEQAKHPGE